MVKERLDILLVRRGLIESRDQAKRLILAGKVIVGNGQGVPKAGQRVASDVELTVKASPRFVGRGGEKLEAAFEAFMLDVAGLVCLDVGASTGGFTDCLLQHGAAKVFAVDVGKGQLAWKLRQDPRVVIMERVNARFLKSGDFPEAPRFASVDVSFISLTKVMPAVTENALSPDADIVTLIKPQFEAGREQVGKGGVVRDPAVRADVVNRIRTFGTERLGLLWQDAIESPLKGPAGNIEFLAYWKKAASRR